jgi:hypothetical protein
MTWTAIAEGLPKTDATVLVAVKDKECPVWVGYREDGEWLCHDGFPIEVTHWMPLPASPKEAT